MKVYTVCSGVMVVMLSFTAGACGAGARDSQGDIAINVSGQASAKDAGLPAYPGAKPYQDAGQSQDAANIGVSTPLFGVKVVAMNLESVDKPERVAAFYRRALSKYGKVLECGDGANSNTSSTPRSKDDDALECDADDRDEDSIVYKVGTENDQRIVVVRPHGGGSRFSLVHVNQRE